MRRALVPLLAALAGGALGGGIVAALDDDGGGETRTVVQQAPLGTGDGEGLDAAEIYERDGPGVVYVVAEVVDPAQTPFDLGVPQPPGRSTGTGFVIDDDGNILTNAHVVENARRVAVFFSEQESVEAEVLGRDRSSDLALLKVDPEGLDLRPLSLGSSAGVKVGDPTVAIGNPFGLSRTLTTGVVSALQRKIDAPDGFTISDVIQTDAAINPGNSGGPLIDAAGRVIGINSAIRTGGAGEGNIGIGFAVPIDTAKRVLPTLKRGEDVERAYLGVTTATVTPDLNLRVDRGAVVQDVAPLGPADRGGLIVGDVIVRLGGEEVASTDDVSRIVERNAPGDELEVEVVRAGERTTETVKLGKRPTMTG